MRATPTHTTRAIAFIAGALMMTATASAAPAPINLADIVGGGDGTGNGSAQGISVTDGAVKTDNDRGGDGSLTPNVYNEVPANDLIDGVVLPDGQDDNNNDIAVQIASDGTEVTGLAEGGTYTFDYLWNGPNPDFKNPNLVGANDISAHATKAVTFDLDAIEAAHGGRDVVEFTGTGELAHDGDVMMYAIVDGDIKTAQQITGSGSPSALDTSIARDAQYLTLATLINGSNKNDHSFFGDPQLTPVPEPATLALLAPAGLLMLRRRR